MDKAECTELFAFNDWANGRVLGALEALDADQWRADLGGSFGSIQATAAHLVVLLRNCGHAAPSTDLVRWDFERRGLT